MILEYRCCLQRSAATYRKCDANSASPLPLWVSNHLQTLSKLFSKQNKLGVNSPLGVRASQHQCDDRHWVFNYHTDTALHVTAGMSAVACAAHPDKVSLCKKVPEFYPVFFCGLSILLPGLRLAILHSNREAEHCKIVDLSPAVP